MKRIDEDFAAPPATTRRDGPLIVHVVRQFLPNRGGLEDVVRNLCLQALAHGFRIRVVTLDTLFSDPSRPLAASETIDGIDIVRIPWKGSSRYPLAPSVLSRIRDADLVHVHAVDFFFDFLALTKLLHGKRMIATTHGGFFHTKRFAAIKALWFKTLTRYSSSRYSYLVGCSQSDMATFAPIAPGNLELIENGADTDKFRDLAAPTPIKRMITIGRFSSNKRLDRLTATMRALVAIDPQWSLDIVGVPSDLSVSDVEALTSGIEPHVRVHAALGNDAIGDLISQGSIFVSASEYEGFGLVAIEAMSAGLLPVLQDNSAYAALAKRHAGLKLTDFSNADGAARALIDAWDDLQVNCETIRKTLLNEADLYSWNRVSERYIRLYRNAIAGVTSPQN